MGGADDGPTRPRGVRSGDRAWVARPVAAGAVRVLATMLPVLGGVTAGLGVGLLLPPAVGLPAVLLWLTLVAAACTVGALLTERLARRLFPLAALLQMSLALPDRTPSRLALARRLGGGNTLAQNLAEARAAGATGARWDAAETVVVLVHSLGLHDRRSRGHSERVRALTDLLTAQLGLPAGDRERMRWAALVHDVGKLAVSAPVLQKAAPLTEPEWASLAAHPQAGAEIAAGLRPWLGAWAPTIEQHHERWDGAGYPAGLSGTDISYGARLLAVVDTYEVMTAGRPYRPAVSAAEARRELTLCAGEQFDPEVVRAFLAVSLGRLRWATGPWAWLATVPVLARAGRLQLAPTAVATSAVGAAAVLAVALGATSLPVPPLPAPPTALAAPVREATAAYPDPVAVPAAPLAAAAPRPVATDPAPAVSRTRAASQAPPAPSATAPAPAPAGPPVTVVAAPVRPVAAPPAAVPPPPAPAAPAAPAPTGSTGLPSRLYLGEDSRLGTTAPTGSSDSAGAEGRPLDRTKKGLAADDEDEFAAWGWTAPRAVRAAPRLAVDLGTLVDYKKDKAVTLTAYLQQCGRTGCTLVATGSGGSASWPARGDDDDGPPPPPPTLRVDLGTVDLTLAAGDTLRLTVVNEYRESEKDVLLYYGTPAARSALVVL